MSQFSYKFTIPDKSKSVIYTKFNNLDTSCLIDTGANTPIWFRSESSFKRRFPFAYKTKYTMIITGLGQKPHLDIPVWCIPEYILIDDDGYKVVFKDLLVPVLNSESYNYHMIISLTMLNRYDFSFSFNNSVSNGFLTLFTPKDTYYVRPVLTKGYLDKIQVFSQDELKEG